MVLLLIPPKSSEAPEHGRQCPVPRLLGDGVPRLWVPSMAAEASEQILGCTAWLTRHVARARKISSRVASSTALMRQLLGGSVFVPAAAAVRRERGRVVVAGRRADDNTRCALVVIHELGGTWSLYPHGVKQFGVRITKADAITMAQAILDSVQ